jgi:hypothetical protein
MSSDPSTQQPRPQQPARRTAAPASARAGSGGRHRGLCVATVAGAVLVALPAPPAQAAPVAVHCGPLTCSVYFSRLVTGRMTTPLAVATVATTYVPGPGGKALGAVAGVVAVKASEAAGKRQCLRVRYLPPTLATGLPVVVGLYSDGSRRCTSR